METKTTEKKFKGIEIKKLNDLKTISRRLKKLKKEYQKNQTPSKRNLQEKKQLEKIYEELLSEKGKSD